jgi:DNA-binding beta-propeller fold protein YncE
MNIMLGSKKKKTYYFLIGLLAIILTFIVQSNYNNYNYNDYNDYKIEAYGAEINKNCLSTPVSITTINENNFIFADYYNVYKLNLIDKTVNKLNISYSSDLQTEYPEIDNKKINTINCESQLLSNQNPTGIFFHHKSKQIYIANYNFHNILIGEIKLDKNEVLINKVIYDIDMVSPENVHVSKDGKTIAVADYDASGVFVFDNLGKLKWKKLGLQMAHGVLVKDKKIYVSLLGESKLQQYDFNGNLISENKNIGYGVNQYLYPTSLIDVPKNIRASYGNGDILVIDAHRGKINIVDDKISTLASWGKNGSEDKYFNLPYGIAITANKLLITDTYKNRIVITDYRNRKIVSVDLKKQINYGEFVEYGHSNDPYCSKEMLSNKFNNFIETYISSDMRNIYFSSGFQKICIFVGEKSKLTQIILPYKEEEIKQKLQRPVNGFSFTYSSILQDEKINYLLIGSPQRNLVMILDTTTGFYDLVKLPENTYIWGYKPHINNNLDSIFDNLLQNFRIKYGQKYKEKQKQYSSSRLATYIATVYDKSLTNFLSNFEKEFIYTYYGKKLTQQWLLGQKIEYSIKQFNQNNEPLFWDELYMLKMLSETSLNKLQMLLSY